MMDCGPAALQALVAGFGVAVNYGRLREACQTSVDGTSISTMDEIASFLGLDTEETMLPIDHLLVPEAHALPAIVVVKTPNGNHHFVVVWSVWGPWIQVMDPAQGRHWVRRSVFVDRLYLHYERVTAAAWRSWVAEREFLDTLDTRLAALGIARPDPGAAVRRGAGEPSLGAHGRARRRHAHDRLARREWHRRAPARCAWRSSSGRSSGAPDGQYPLIVREYGAPGDRLPLEGDVEEPCCACGAWCSCAPGRRDPSARPRPPRTVRSPRSARPAEAPPRPPARLHGGRRPRRRRDAGRARRRVDRATRSGRERTLLGLLVADGLATPAVLGMALVVSAALVTVNAILLRGILEVGQQLGLPSQRTAADGRP